MAKGNKTEIIIGIALNLCLVLAFLYLPDLWKLIQESQNSFVAKIYWLVSFILFVCSICALIFDYVVAVDSVKWIKKIGK